MGRILRDDDAIQMVKTALCSVPFDREALAGEITIVMANESERFRNRLQKELLGLEAKQHKVLEAYCAGRLTEDEYRTIMQHCARRITESKQALEDHTQIISKSPQVSDKILELLTGKVENAQLYRALVDEITVYPDRHTEVRLVDLPDIFYFS